MLNNFDGWEKIEVSVANAQESLGTSLMLLARFLRALDDRKNGHYTTGNPRRDRKPSPGD
jgi:hypothetical protein